MSVLLLFLALLVQPAPPRLVLLGPSYVTPGQHFTVTAGIFGSGTYDIIFGAVGFRTEEDLIRSVHVEDGRPVTLDWHLTAPARPGAYRLMVHTADAQAATIGLHVVGRYHLYMPLVSR